MSARPVGLVVMDIGDVVVRTAPDVQYARLSDLTGVTAGQVTAAAEDGLVIDLETGVIDFPKFVRCLCARLGVRPLPVAAAEEAWNRVIVGLDKQVAEATAALVAQRRLIWATNTSPPHWARIRGWFQAEGMTAPAQVSYELGHRKPPDAFFLALGEIEPRVHDGALFVDDRIENVHAAIRHHMTGWLHRDPDATAARLLELASELPAESTREGER